MEQARQDREVCLEESEQGFSLKSKLSYFYKVRLV